MLVFSLLLTIGLAAWLVFIFGFPRRWNALVDAENDFWTGKGVMPKSVSDWTRRFEKSLLFKSLVGPCSSTSSSLPCWYSWPEPREREPNRSFMPAVAAARGSLNWIYGKSGVALEGIQATKEMVPQVRAEIRVQLWFHYFRGSLTVNDHKADWRDSLK